MERRLALYRALLEPLGFARLGEIIGEQGERVVYLDNDADGSAVSVRERRSEAHVPYDRYAVGLHHLAFAASSRVHKPATSTAST